MNTLRAWWNYSRTVFINAALALVAISAELAQFLVGFDWTTIMSARAAGFVVIAVNVLNIVLRFMTTAPVGEKDAV